MTLPLACFTLHAQSLPEDMTPERQAAFSLPGAKALESFADLLGNPDEEAQEDEATELESAPFSLPAMLPDALNGPVSLTREIDFGALHGDRAVLTLGHIAGSGRILLGDRLLAAFDGARLTADALSAAHAMTAQPCALSVDLTEALELGRRKTLVIEFDDSRPAGLPGPVLLHVTTGAHLSHVALLPQEKHQAVCVRAQIAAARAGRYVLRAQSFAPDGQPCDAWETPLTLEVGEVRRIEMRIPFAAKVFVPGKAYEASSVKLLLFARPEHASSDGLLCDSATLLCGYPAKAPRAWLPLSKEMICGDPAGLAAQLSGLHVPAVSLNAPAPDSVYRALCRAGVAVRQTTPDGHPLKEALAHLPCVAFLDQPEADAPLSLEASAWQLCSMAASPRALDETLTARELLLEASGRPLDPQDEGVRSVLLWLRALSIRLRAEAARQQRYDGAICQSGEWDTGDAAQALRTAFAPLHLSALPLCGAWWTGTRFSASLEAFIPAGISSDGITAIAALEDGEGAELVRFTAPCPPQSGYLGVIECALPDHPCVLELTCRLLRGDEVIEENTMPVYVGERGQLEAAFI